jgi:hypothetical protein
LRTRTDEPGWLEALGITDLTSGLAAARLSRNALLEPGERVIGASTDLTTLLLVFQGFLARAQGFHEASVAAIAAGNPYATFTLLRGYAENAAAILYSARVPGGYSTPSRERGGGSSGDNKSQGFSHSRESTGL